MSKKAIAEKIYETLTKQTFADFYGADMESNAPFSLHLCDGRKNKDEIIQEIIRIFKL